MSPWLLTAVLFLVHPAKYVPIYPYATVTVTCLCVAKERVKYFHFMILLCALNALCLKSAVVFLKLNVTLFYLKCDCCLCFIFHYDV